MVEGARELSGFSFMRALNPFTRAPPSRPKHFPQAQLPNIIMLGLRSSHMNLEGDTVMQSTAYEKAKRQRSCLMNLCSP